ncbi:MAG: hypothetical protein IPH95_01380 [Candidatus Promineofilum sp.]|jgi:hypothetical protein|nr:hypothetical protein [Promineifilum sp.]
MTTQQTDTTQNALSGFIRAAGVILAISYPVLALSTGARALYQLFFKEGVTDLLPPLLSAVAAVCYLLATVGFVVRRHWAWRLSVSMLVFELVMVLLVGTLSTIMPDTIGRTVWANFGADYGYFPLIQPILGLAWLFHRETRAAYELGVRD